MDSAFPVLIFGAFVVLVIVLAIFGAIAAKKRREAFAAIAARLGLAFSPDTIAKSSDPDGDGYSNWSEYLLGRDPRLRDTQLPLWLSVQQETMLLHVLVADVEPAGGITVETSTDLTAWTPANDLDFLGALKRGSLSERRFDTARERAGRSARFFRLRLSAAPE